jgi:hypothetical protein
MQAAGVRPGLGSHDVVVNHMAVEAKEKGERRNPSLRTQAG